MNLCLGCRAICAPRRVHAARSPPQASLIPSRVCAETDDNDKTREGTMSLSDDLAYMSATELARRIRQRQLSPVEVVDAAIARIEKRNPAITAFVYFGFDDARKA